MGRRLFQYFVEGECEKNFISSFIHAQKSDLMLQPGKIEKLNPVTQKISEAKALTINNDTKVVFVFDTDIQNTQILDANIETLKDIAGLEDDDIILVMSVKNFEEELIYSAVKFKNINQLFSTKGIHAFKKEFANCKNIEDKLLALGFDLKLIWARQPNGNFNNYKNNSKLIKIKK